MNDFRSMRRFKQQITQEECLAVLKAEKRGVLSLLGKNGYPYGVPMNHWFCEEDGRVTACLRAFREDEGLVRMGRVLTLKHGTGLGGELLKKGLKEIRERMAPQRIRIEAQTYAAGFYEREGFHVTSEEFMEDGIPHVEMILECGTCLGF